MSVVGPFNLKADQSVDEISVVLTRGFSAKVKIVDPAGNPIEGAKVNAMSNTMSRYGGGGMVVSGPDGVVELPNLPIDPDIRLNIKATRFQSYMCSLDQETTETQTVVLAPCRPTVGVITAKETGKPIADAEIYQGNNGDPRERWARGENDIKPLTQTDAQGHYELNDLDSGNQTALYISTPDGRFKILSNVTPGRTINLVLPEPIIVSGKFTGNLSKLRRSGRNMLLGGKSEFTSVNSYYRPEYGGEYRTQFSTPVNVVDGHGEFEIKYLMPGKLEIQIGDQVLKFDLEKSQTDLEINLDSANPTTHPSDVSKGDAPQADAPAVVPNPRRLRGNAVQPPATRPSSALPPGMGGEGGRANFSFPSVNLSILMPVVSQVTFTQVAESSGPASNADKPKELTKTLTVKLLPPEGVAEVHGYVRAQIYRRNGGSYIPPQWREVKDGQVQFDVPVACSIELNLTRMPGVTGYINQVNLSEKMADQKAMAMERLEPNGTKVTVDADGNYQFSVPLRSAGALHCTITREDGQPISGNAQLNVQYPSGQFYQGGYRSNGITTPIDSDDGGEFLLTGIPLGVDFTVSLDGSSIGRSLGTITSPVMRLSATKSIDELKMVIPNGKTFTVHVVDNKEQPVGGISVRVMLKIGENRWANNSGQELRTDGLGRLVIPNVVMDQAESVVVLAGGSDGWQRASVTVQPDQDQATLILSPGLHLKGVLLDDASGRPIIGVRLNAQSQSNGPFGSPSESSITDEQGQFEFYSLALGDIQIYADNIQLPQGQTLDASPTQEKPVVLRGMLNQNSQQLRLGDLPPQKSAE